MLSLNIPVYEPNATLGVMILPAQIWLCTVSACVSVHVVRRNVNRGLSMRVRQALNDAGLQQQMPVFVSKCANNHRHVSQKANLRKWPAFIRVAIKCEGKSKW